MAETATDWNGVVIRTGTSDSKLFVGLVKAALATIDSKPVGNALRQAIESEILKVKFGYLVCIKPNASVKKSFLKIKWRDYSKGSTTFGSNMVDSKNGAGTVSAVKWDPKTQQTPDGARPPFIALAHELIHCMHNLRGTSYLTGAGDVKVDEMIVTGLKGYEQEPISENRIREEHGVRYRCSYHGQCSAAEGAPDEDAF